MDYLKTLKPNENCFAINSLAWNRNVLGADKTNYVANCFFTYTKKPLPFTEAAFYFYKLMLNN